MQFFPKSFASPVLFLAVFLCFLSLSLLSCSSEQPGGKPGESDGERTDPLIRAVSIGDVSEARSLIESGANVNATGEGGVNPLVITAQTGKIEIASLLVKSGADVNIKTFQGITPITLAAGSGHGDIVKLLIERPPE